MINRQRTVLACLLVLAMQQVSASRGAPRDMTVPAQIAEEENEQMDGPPVRRRPAARPSNRKPAASANRRPRTGTPSNRSARIRRPAGDDSVRPASMQAPRVTSSEAPVIEEEIQSPEMMSDAPSVPMSAPGPMSDPHFEDNFQGGQLMPPMGGCCGNRCFGCNACDSCDSCGGCGPCGSCGPCGPGFRRFYARGEYILWWLSGDRTPPLVTTSPATTPFSQAGVLGPNSSVLFGGDSLTTQARSGARVTLGWWVDPGLRIEGEWFGLGQAQSSFHQSSDGSTILARPFFELQNNFAGSNIQGPSANVIAYPGRLSGSISAVDTSNFLGAGVQALKNLKMGTYGPGSQYRLDALYGFRYLSLDQNLTINSSSTQLVNQIFPAGTTFTAADGFKTSNNFYGLNVGMLSERRSARWTLTSIGRLGLGATQERIAITGHSTATIPPSTTALSEPGGLLALPTNIGTFSHHGFAVVPQLELKLGYDLTPNLRATFGYDVFYWSRVAMPGGQIDTASNTSQSFGGTLTGIPGPRFVLRETDMWVQGISTGLQYRF